MRRELVLLSGLTLLPAMIGPLEAEAGGFVVPLCGGGVVTVPGGPSEGPPGPPQGPCCAKGCQSGSSRKRLDRSQ
ncbi:hypothetical protein [Novosphingobium mangrovi (ex Huang et al. 2023)]|uniref:Secreted protein n=1 Tax=Novosphingobium mangrovi (ex Huang et al. 2023) TaxID=2976432 RepID=A0ABT2I1X4_9SPHN|nr:hypothetical protein [Novosphingobium mangrovi (ex Huang et al. 2023)]MCT2398607.1 hypothetical protein [Novosphingobium mangrovi (ex Huang et al. 2023)]